MELVASVLGTDPGVLAESLKSADGNLKPTSEIEGFLKEHFGKKLNEVKRSGIDEGYGRGKKESLTSKEKELAQKFEISDYQGFDGLFDAIITKHSQTSKLNPDDVRKSEHYITDIKAKNEEIKKWKSELDTFKGQVEHEKVSSKVNQAIISIIEDPQHKYVIPANKTIKDNVVNAMLSKVWNGDYKFEIGEKAIGIRDKDGNPLQDELMTPIKLDDWVHGLAKGYFEVQQGDNRSGTGASTQGSGSGGGLQIKSSEDFMRQYTTEPDPIKRAAIKTQYESMVSKGLIK